MQGETVACRVTVQWGDARLEGHFAGGRWRLGGSQCRSEPAREGHCAEQDGSLQGHSAGRDGPGGAGPVLNLTLCGACRAPGGRMRPGWPRCRVPLFGNLVFIKFNCFLFWPEIKGGLKSRTSINLI